MSVAVVAGANDDIFCIALNFVKELYSFLKVFLL